MKYIIDIPDEYENDYISMSPLVGKEFCYPIRNMNKNKTYVIPTGLKIEPYTEPDEDEIRQKVEVEVGDEVWEFVDDAFWSMTQEDIDECYDGWFPESYQEAKAKYEEWKNQKDLRIGDEVILPDETKGIVMNREDDDCVVINKDSYTIVYHVSELRNTGRHHDCIISLAELLKRYRDAV